MRRTPNSHSFDVEVSQAAKMSAAPERFLSVLILKKRGPIRQAVFSG